MSNDTKGDAVCILSFGKHPMHDDATDWSRYSDSGGPGTHSQLLIVNEMMVRLAHDLNQGSKKMQENDIAYAADHFDLMGGVGFGGWVLKVWLMVVVENSPVNSLAALMLGHLRMDADQAIEALQDVAAAVFTTDRPEKHDPKQNLINLKAAIGKMLKDQNLPVDLMMVDERMESPGCKVWAL
jgi:hypothetical protein